MSLLQCPGCGGPTVVMSTKERPGRTWRRLRCKACGARFSSEETVTWIMSPGEQAMRVEPPGKRN